MKYVIMKEPPPLLAACTGNRRKLPRPMALPAMARIRPIRLPHASFDVIPELTLSLPPQSVMDERPCTHASVRQRTPRRQQAAKSEIGLEAGGTRCGEEDGARCDTASS
jgi:hypothetical protein